MRTMKYANGKVSGIKIGYIGGGSRGWAWGLMSDLASCGDISGEVRLYDIDRNAADSNEIIGNRFRNAPGTNSEWNYRAVDTLEQALAQADFVVISILPGTFDEMESDVHAPEAYGIYQSVGDTTGPGGIVRAMRTVPMYETIAKAIREHCPQAWVINYTNPMTLCVKTLYREFPEIKAFGCCHEVFGTQKILAKIVEQVFCESSVDRSEIKVNVLGVNHFTWLTQATYHNIDLFPVYDAFIREHGGAFPSDGTPADDNWMNNSFVSEEMVKMDLFRRFGWIAAAGDRHLAEFCEGAWYLANPERVREMHFGLTSVAWRKQDLAKRIARSQRMVSGEEPVKIKKTGEEGVHQMRARLGLCELTTNVNIPNRGQIPNLPLGAVVETNAVFRAGSLQPVFAGPVPKEIYPLVGRICSEQELVFEGIAERNLDKIFMGFAADPLTTCGIGDAKKLFAQMCRNTQKYLTMYPLDRLPV